jgi:hypothetical protein
MLPAGEGPSEPLSVVLELAESLPVDTLPVFPMSRPLQLATSPRPSNPVLPSIIAQIDGLLHAVFRLRLERDVCGGPTASYCVLSGAGISSSSTFCGLFLPWPRPLGSVAVAVRAERGCGVFIGPTADVHAIDGRILLEFSFLALDGVAWRAALVSFAFAGKVRRKRPETFFPLVPIDPSPAVIGLLPFCPGRASTLSPCSRPDSSASVPPLPVFPGCFPVPPSPSRWNQATMGRFAGLFPCPILARLSVSAASPAGSDSCFSGDRTKRVLSPNMPLSAERMSQVRVHLLAEVAAGRVLGPFDRAPFPNAWCSYQPRNASLGAVPSDKWNPTSDAFRLISSFSVRAPSSVNDLVYTPRVIAFRLQASHVRDVLASKGPRPRFRAIDHRKAFRSNRCKFGDLHLACYELNGEWFVDLFHPFGSVVSEWSYDCIGEVLSWALLHLGVCADFTSLCRFVDNWFFFAERGDPTADARWLRCTALLASAGVDLHEEQDLDVGPVLALGWEWRAGEFVCPTPKYDVLLRVVHEWNLRSAARLPFSVVEIERLVGLLGWVATAAPSIRPLAGAVRSVLNSARGRRRLPLVLSPEAVAGVELLLSFLVSWDRCTPISMGFSPASSWEGLIRTDASTDFGAGGFVFPLAQAFVYEWSPDDRVAASRRVRESTSFFELRAVLLALQLFGPALKGQRVQFECDSEPAVIALRKCYSPEPGCCAIIHSICLLCSSFHITPRFEHILGTFNAIADSLSHGLFPQARLLAGVELGCTLSQVSCRQ